MQNHLFTYCFLGGLLLALSFPASGQRAVEDGGFPGYSSFLSPEKVYLHTDREVYNIGDTIWFRGYLENVSDLAEYPACNYLYVELFLFKMGNKPSTEHIPGDEPVEEPGKSQT